MRNKLNQALYGIIVLAAFVLFLYGFIGGLLQANPIICLLVGLFLLENTGMLTWEVKRK